MFSSRITRLTLHHQLKLGWGNWGLKAKGMFEETRCIVRDPSTTIVSSTAHDKCHILAYRQDNTSNTSGELS